MYPSVEKLRNLGPKEFTNGATLGEAMNVKDSDEAAAFLDELVKQQMIRFPNDLRTGELRTEPEVRRVMLSNIGYYAGYYDRETFARVSALYGAAHPIFGTTWPTSEEAFAMGVAEGEKMKNA